MAVRELFLMLLAACASTPASPAIPPPSSFLHAGRRTKVIFVGTFHFADAGLDSNKPQHDINIMEPARQKEVEALLRS